MLQLVRGLFGFNVIENNWIFKNVESLDKVRSEGYVAVMCNLFSCMSLFILKSILKYITHFCLDRKKIVFREISL